MSTSVTVVGGVYGERCTWPEWDQVYGSGGRAAVAMSGNVSEVILTSCVSDALKSRFAHVAALNGIAFDARHAGQSISFDYLHPMAVPDIRPSIGRIERQPTIHVDAPFVLRFGMLETTARVRAKRCVYDPQSAFGPEAFASNGSSADELAIVANRAEVTALAGHPDPMLAAQALLEGGHAEAVVVKAGALGAFVASRDREVVRVPARRSARSFTLGSGDVFAATFCTAWGVGGADPVEAARLASKAVAEYVGSMALPTRPLTILSESEVSEVMPAKGGVYLAGPFFTVAQRWFVDEARRCLTELGQSVFSPVHDVGPGPAAVVAPADLEALRESEAVFALLDGLDPGTLFEVGYARALGKPVFALAQQVPSEDLKMFDGTGCRVHDDFVTAMHDLAWRS